jgi:transcriptional regulator with XRE-family HTH domain
MAVSVNGRLKEVRKALVLSQRNFCKSIYVSQSFYARIEQGKLKPNARIIELVCSQYHVNKEWLLAGKGEMFDQIPNVKLNQMIEIFNDLNDLFQDYVLVQIKELLKVQKKSKEE